MSKITLTTMLLLLIFNGPKTSAQWMKQEDIEKVIEYITKASKYNEVKKGKGDDDNYNNDDDDNYNNDDDDNYNNDDNYNDDDDNNDIPLDGGLSFLALAGVGFGIKKVRDNRAKNKDTNNGQK